MSEVARQALGPQVIITSLRACHGSAEPRPRAYNPLGSFVSTAARSLRE